MDQDDRSHDHVLHDDDGVQDRTQAAGRAHKRPKAGSLVLARTPAPGVAALARLLAHAFLDAPDWRREDLVDAGAYVLGARRRWLGPLVRSVLTGYPRRPAGAPRELSRWIAAQPALTDAVVKAAANSRPIAPSHVLPAAAGDRSHVLPGAGPADERSHVLPGPAVAGEITIASSASSASSAVTALAAPTVPTAGGGGARESRGERDASSPPRVLRSTPGRRACAAPASASR